MTEEKRRLEETREARIPWSEGNHGEDARCSEARNSSAEPKASTAERLGPGDRRSARST